MPSEEIGTSRAGRLVEGNVTLCEEIGASETLPYEEIGTSSGLIASRRDATQWWPDTDDGAAAEAPQACAASEVYAGGRSLCIATRNVHSTARSLTVAQPRARRAPCCLCLEGVEEDNPDERNREQHEGTHDMGGRLSPTSVISEGTVRRPRQATMAKKGMKKVKKSDGTKKEDSHESKNNGRTKTNDSELLAAQRERSKLRTRLLLTQYELELVAAGGGLSQCEDLSLKIRSLEDGLDQSTLRPSSGSKLSRPMAPEGMHPVKPSKTWLERLSALEASARSLTSLSDRADQTLLTLHRRAMEEQLGTDDVIGRCAAKSQPVTNPMCPSKSNEALDTMLPNSMVANRGMIYLSTNTDVLKQLAGGVIESEDDSGQLNAVPKPTTVQMFSKESVGRVDRCHSLSADITLGHALTESAEVRMVVDSGAAESGADAQHFLRQYPQLETHIESVTDRRFVDAQDREIPLVGKVRMRVCLNNYCYETYFYLFALRCTFPVRSEFPCGR